jgi:DEAD/DEAH box helicase domain-containing protein
MYPDILSLSVRLVHLQCAAYEMPLTSGDQKWFGASMVDTCEKNLTKDRDGWRVS